MPRFPVDSLIPTILSLVPRFSVSLEENCVKEGSPCNRDHDQELRSAEAAPRTVVCLYRCKRRKPALGEVVFD